MSKAHRPNRLAQCLNAPGGIKAEDALFRAGAAIEMRRDKGLEHIEQRLDQLGHLIANVGASPSEGARKDLHRLSNDVLSVAALFGREGLGDAAYSLCELLTDLEARHAWDAAPVRVHYEAMRILRTPDLISPEAQARLVKELHKVSRAGPRILPTL
jgi:hypothetical protein